MKKIIVLVIIFILAITSLYFLIDLRKEIEEKEKTLKQVEENEVVKELKILESEKVLLNYSIEEFKEWAEENWKNIFEKPPRFVEGIEETKVTPKDFRSFDKTSVFSPNKEKIAFSVHSYFAASYMSFVGVINIKTKEAGLISEENRGNVEQIIWSPQGDHLAYTLGTGRSKSDYLSVDNIKEMKKSFTLSEEDLLKILKEDQFMPRFRDLKWEENKLYFKTDHPTSKKDIEWFIKKDGSELTKK